MAKRPPGSDPASWRAERDQVWRLRNRVFNLLMLAVIVAVLARYYWS